MLKTPTDIKPAEKLLFALIFSILALISADPAVASDKAYIEAGEKAVSQNKFEDAVQHLTKAIGSEGLSGEDTAKALYLRGVAFLKKGEPARSIADLTRALFFKKIPGELKSRILVARAGAYQAVGLASRAENDMRAAGTGGTAIASVQRVQPAEALEESRSEQQEEVRPVVRKPTIKVIQSEQPRETAEEPRETVVSQGWGASVKTSPIRQEPRRVASVEPRQIAQSQNSFTTSSTDQGNGYKSMFEEKAREVENRPVRNNNNYRSSEQIQPRNVAHTQSAPVKPSVAYASSDGSGRYRLQLAAVSSENDAREAWSRLLTQHGSLLSGQNPDFQTVNLGNSKSVVRIQIGPFADKLQTMQLCNSFKQQGLDCFLVVR